VDYLKNYFVPVCIFPGFENYSISYVRFEIFTVVALNSTVFFDVVLRSMVEIYLNSHLQFGWRQQFSWNVIKFLPHYAASHPRRQSS
jgi:hypothetical protein